MSAEIKIIHQLCHNEIFEKTSTSQADMKAWMASSNYLMANSLVKTSTRGGNDITNTFELKTNDTDALYIAMANDSNRFAQAAIESMWLINKDVRLPKSAGWTTVKMYYAAFYAAHSILRMFGRGCTQYEKAHIDKVLEIAVATGEDNNVKSIENGFYLSKTDKNTKNTHYTKLKDSHADTWSSFAYLLDDILSGIPDNTTGLGTHKDSAFNLVSNLKSALVRPDAYRGNWLSQVRNKVHYQHTNGAWFPYVASTHNPVDISRNTRWVQDPTTFDVNDKPNDIIGTLSNISNCIVSIMHNLLIYGNERTDNKSVIYKNGYVKLFNQIYQ